MIVANTLISSFKINYWYYRYIINLKSVEDDPHIDRWLEWDSVQLQVKSTIPSQYLS